MAYNFWVESAAKIDWEQLNKSVQPFQLLEYVPMPGMGLNGGDAIGLSIPMRNTGRVPMRNFYRWRHCCRRNFSVPYIPCIMERLWMTARWNRLKRILYEAKGNAFESC